MSERIIIRPLKDDMAGWVTSSYPGLMGVLAVPSGHGRWWGWWWPCGATEHRHPDAARFRGAAVHPHRVLEAPVRPSRRRAWEHSSGHWSAEFAQFRIANSPHGPHMHSGTWMGLWTTSRCRNIEGKPREDGWC